MSHRGIQRLGFGLALVAILLSVVSPVPASALTDAQLSRLRTFWEASSPWLDPNIQMSLRPTNRTDRWEILVRFDGDERWVRQGFFNESFRRQPGSPMYLEDSLRNLVDSFDTVIAIGEVKSTAGSSLYVVAAILEGDSSLQDAARENLKPFVPLSVRTSYQEALVFAQMYEKVFDGSISDDPSVDPLNSPLGAARGVEEKLACDQICSQVRLSNLSACGGTFTLCQTAAAATLLACSLGCGGVPVCEGVCIAAYLLLLADCTADHLNCRSNAEQIYELCLANCTDGGPGCGASATETSTTTLLLEPATPAVFDPTPTEVSFPLSRAEARGLESFIVDEWALVENGRTISTSNSEFGRAVTEQAAAPSQGLTLLVQEPAHVVNGRHIPKPEVSVSSTGLARAERGNGELVAARLEFAPSKVIDRVTVIYNASGLDETRLQQLLRRQVGLVFRSEKQHRTIVYVVLRVTSRLERVAALAALPQCCCGEVFCI